MSNPFFIGMFRYDGELYEGIHTPIISRKQQQGKLSAIQEKLDRLLDAHLDGVITRAEYVRRKERLLHEKAGLTD